MTEVTKAHGQQPILIAHRGYSGNYPENTLIAYQAAYDCGARFVELDLHLTADHIAVLHHDTSLMRMAGTDADIFNIPSHQLERFNASYPKRFGDVFSDNKLTRFRLFCEWLKEHPNVTAFVEIKEESIHHFGLSTVMDSIYSDIRKTHTQTQCVVISFNSEAIEYTQKKLAIKTGWVLPAWNNDAHQRLAQLEPDFIFCDTKILPEKSEPIWAGSWQWAVYNVDTVNAAIAMVNRGIYFLETNEIGTLAKDTRLNREITIKT